jgi:hypothetical protein
MDSLCQYIAPVTGERCNAGSAKAVRIGYSWQVRNPEDPDRVITFYASRLCAEHRAIADELRKSAKASS